MQMMIADSDRGVGILSSIGKLSVKIGTRIRLVDLMNIAYIRACRDYVDIAMASGEMLHTKEQITRLENDLPAYLFARVHRSYIVNTEYIQEIRVRQNDYDLVLNTGTVITSGSNYRKQIRERFVTVRDNGLVVRAVPAAGHGSPVGLRSISGHHDRKQDDLRIRVCSPGDEQSLALLGQATYIETHAGIQAWSDILEHCASRHSPGFYRAWLEDRQTRIWMLETESTATPVGYLALTPADPSLAGSRDDDLEIQRMYLLERYHDPDADARLLAEAVRHAEDNSCRRLLTLAHEKNTSHLEFYGRAGFRTQCEYQARIGSGEYRDLVLGLEV